MDNTIIVTSCGKCGEAIWILPDKYGSKIVNECVNDDLVGKGISFLDCHEEHKCIYDAQLSLDL